MTQEESTVAVIGAGMVGVACALELQRRGLRVTLLDRRPPGQETSYGNAGVLARSSLMPFNNPGLWASLPRLIRNQSAQFRYDPGYLARNTAWAVGFVARARRMPFEETAAALDSLIRLSMAEHIRLLRDSGASHRLRDNGWIFLYRTDESYAGSRLARDMFERHGVATELLDAHALSDLEPHLAPIFRKALWIKDTASVDNPGRVVEAYARTFSSRGGVVECREIVNLERDKNLGWRLLDAQGKAMKAQRVVIALGPWAKEFLQRLGLSVPMAFERGYHMHYDARSGEILNRPIYDTGGGYVLSPMEQGLRLTTGVELTDRDADKNFAQLDLAEQSARRAFPLGKRLESEPWLGRRPTLPDSRPIIGECPARTGLWLAFGHQHIGFSTGPGTASVLASLMFGERPAIDVTPFRPERFVS